MCGPGIPCSASSPVSPIIMTWNLVRLVLRARALSLWRVIVAIAAEEPSWFFLVVGSLIGGGAWMVLHLDPRRLTPVLGAIAVMIAVLSSLVQRDARLHRILGVSPRLVRVVEGLLLSFPFIAVAAFYSLRDAAVIASSVAAVGFVAGEAKWRSTARRAPRRIPMIPTTLPEWTVGLRRSAPIIGVAMLGGMVGSGSPGAVVLALMSLTLATSAFFWEPAEGWLLIHASGEHAARFLSRKLLASVGVLSAMVAPIVVLGVLRAPQYWLVYVLALAICLHTHAAAVLVKYAAYRQGQPLDAAGTLIWLITAAAILVPPVGIMLLVWLHRRAAARLADFCVAS